MLAGSLDPTWLVGSAETLDIQAIGNLSVAGHISSPQEIDVFSVTAQADGYLYLDLAGYDGLDGFIQVCSSTGRRLGRNNNASRYTLDSRLRVKVKAGQEYYVLASSNKALTAGSYQLRLTSSPTDDYGNTFQTAKTVRLSSSGSLSLSGRINYAGDVDVLSFVATKTGTVQVDMTRYNLSSMLDSILSAYDAQGDLLATNDDFGTSLDSRVRFDVVAGQSYYLKAAGYETSTGRYRVTVITEAAPEPPPEPAPSPSPTDPTPGQTITAQIISQPNGMQLLILGTTQDDWITLSQTGSAITLTTGAGSQSFTGAFASLTIYGFAGNDTIRLTNSVTVASSIYAGDGNDSIFEASLAGSLLDGGAGDDLLVSIGGGADTIIGGGGLDSFWVDSSDTIRDASSAENAGGCVHRITEFYQPYTADRSSPNYVSLEIAGQNLADPATTYAYRNFSNRPLFVTGPHYNDVAQGALGDCYLLASLASLADTDPGLIQQMIAPLGDGTYAVRFYRGGQPVYLRIDGDLPTYTSGSLVYARTGAYGALWVPLVEKAYAYFRYGQNSYASLSGGWMSTVFQEVTNLGTPSISGTVSDQQFYDFLASNLSAGHAVTAGSYSTASGPIIGGHAYMVKSVQSSGGALTATLYNPWAIDGTSYDSNPNDGLVTLTIAQMRQYFMAAVASLA